MIFMVNSHSGVSAAALAIWSYCEKVQPGTTGGPTLADLSVNGCSKLNKIFLYLMIVNLPLL